MGDAGQTFVTETLGSEKPQKAIQLIQQAAALQDPRTKPLLSLLDHLGVSRCRALVSSDGRVCSVILVCVLWGGVFLRGGWGGGGGGGGVAFKAMDLSGLDGRIRGTSDVSLDLSCCTSPLLLMGPCSEPDEWSYTALQHT